jgi:hypothetical protein
MFGSPKRPLAEIANEIIAMEAECLNAEARRQEAERDRKAAAEALARLREEIDAALAPYAEEPAEPLYFPTHARSISASAG